MTDWDRVAALRSRGKSWEEIARDPKVGFQSPEGASPGRALKTLYYRRRSAASANRTNRPTDARGTPSGGLRRAPRRWTALIAGVSIVAGIALVIYLVGVVAPGSTSNDLVTYCGGEGQAAHYHPLLIIESNGVQQHLPYDPSQPADIGYINAPGFTNPSLYCSAGGIHALHTHDGSGIIHAELPQTLVSSSPTLGEFFQIWGVPLDSGHVWTFSGVVRATVEDLHTGARTDYSGNPASIPLYPPFSGPVSNPFPVPQNLIFGGQYGDGSSGGGFSGEIIWLNVTSAGSAMSGTCTVLPLHVTCTLVDEAPDPRR